MTRRTDRRPRVARHLQRVGAVVRAATGAVVLAVACGVSVEVSRAWAGGDGQAGPLPYLVRAALTSVAVVPLLLWWWRRRHVDLEGIGAGRPVFKAAALGVAVALATGVVTWSVAAVAGWIRLDGVDPVQFGMFLVLVGSALLLFEALPEEVALRGWAWSTLREGLGPVASTTLVTAIFPLVAALISATSVVASRILGTSPARFAWFPDEPIVYIAQLVTFGLVLVAARTLPIRGALWVGVGFHWGQLMLTRIVLWPPTAWTPTGWAITFVQPDAIALVLAHLVLAGMVFLALRRNMNRTAARHESKDHPAATSI